MRLMFWVMAAIFVGSAVSAQQMTAVAVSPDGATVLAAGDNRVLYTLDGATLEVTDRKYIPQQVKEIHYSRDGRRIFLRMDNRLFRAHAAGSFKMLFEVENISSMSLASDAERLALLEDNYDGGVLHIMATSGKLMKKMEYPDIDTELVAMSADGRTAMLLTDSDKSDTEPKESAPSDLKGYDKYVFRQKNDGYISQILNVNVGDGSHTINDTFYRISFPFAIRMLGDKMAIINGAQDSGLVSADGSTQLINLGDSYVSAGRISDDGTQVVLTSNNDVTIHPLDNGVAGDAIRELEVERIDGPSERVTAMDEGADGTLYMVTSGYRIWRIAPGASDIEIKPVF